jgi:mRNA interferase MazF
MTESDVGLARMHQADGNTKLRPVFLIRQIPPYSDWLVCVISSQVQSAVEGFDVVIDTDHADFQLSGPKVASSIRVGFLAVLPTNRIAGRIGRFSSTIHQAILKRLRTLLS